MKRVLLALIVAVAVAVATASPAMAITLKLPNGKTVVGLPDAAAHAAKSGVVRIEETCWPPGAICNPPAPSP